jgi:hypothetical protein
VRLVLSLLLATGVLLATSPTHAQAAAAPALREACDAENAPPLRSQYTHWRCSGLVAATYADLERLVQEGHDVARGWKAEDKMTLYTARSGKDSAWLFLRDVQAAIRWSNEYAADGTWSGLAYTVFCAGAAEDCRKAQGFVLVMPPPPGLGPPPPAEPPVIHEDPASPVKQH